MHLLIKTITDPENPRNDNSDKKPLFPSGTFQLASDQREAWVFVHDDGIARNISYQLQYIEFLVRLYNEYQFYLTFESLLCKNILISVNSIMEAALYDAILHIRTVGNMTGEWRSDYTALLGQAYHSYGLIDRELWHFFHDLRKERNNLHLHALTEREFGHYNITQTNEALEKLEQFRQAMSGAVEG